MKISFNPSHMPSPWRLYHRGESTWFRTEKQARKAAEDIERGIRQLKRRLRPRQVDDYLHCRELLKGVPLLRAVRYYIEAHRAQSANSKEKSSVMIERFSATIGGRPKYVAEAKRNLALLSDSIGELAIGDVAEDDIAEFLEQFGSKWSHDAALKFARSFFKWAIGARIKARRDNPTAPFEFSRPRGSKIYLKLTDVEHVLKVCREEFEEILPAVGLQLFAGIRTEEIIRADWSMVRRGMIRLEPEAAKMGEVKGKHEARIIDFWPKALDVLMPAELPTSGPLVADIPDRGKGLHHRFRDLKGQLIERCKQTKPDFRWGQNAFRHSYGTYAYAFFQSGDRVTKLMGERDVDTLINHYAEIESEENGQKFFSIGSSELESLPLSKRAEEALGMIRKLVGISDRKIA